MKCFYNFTNKEMRYFGRHRERYSIYLKVFNCGLSIRVYLLQTLNCLNLITYEEVKIDSYI